MKSSLAHSGGIRRTLQGTPELWLNDARRAPSNSKDAYLA